MIYTTCQFDIVDPVLFVAFTYISAPIVKDEFVLTFTSGSPFSAVFMYNSPIAGEATVGEARSCTEFTDQIDPRSSTVAVLFLMSFPVVELYRAIPFAVADAGHTTSHVQESVKSPLHSRVFPFIVLMFVPDTSVSCFPVFRLEKLVFITDLESFGLSVPRMFVIVVILLWCYPTRPCRLV